MMLYYCFIYVILSHVYAVMIFYGYFLHKKLSYEAYDLPWNKFSKLFDIAFAETKIEAET